MVAPGGQEGGCVLACRKADFVVIGSYKGGVSVGVYFPVGDDGGDAGPEGFFGYCGNGGGFEGGNNQYVYFTGYQLADLFYLPLVAAVGVFYYYLYMVVVGCFDIYFANHGFPPGVVEHALRQADYVLLFLVRAGAAGTGGQGDEEEE